jgi:glutathione S-transferase
VSSDIINFDETKLPGMKIYDFPSGPYPTRVRIALAEKNLQSRVQFVMVDLYKGEHKKPEFIAQKNYSGTLPVLELTGRTPLEKGLIHMMNKRAELELLDAISVYFHHSTPGLGPDVEIYQNAEWGFRQRDKALRGMHYFDDVLKRQPFVAGEAFSMADIAVIGGLIFASIVKLPVPSKYEALQAWYARMQERPSVKNQPAFSVLTATSD